MDVFLVARVRSIFNLGDRVLWVQAQPSQYAISREMNSGQLVQMSVSKVFAPVDGWEMNIDRLDGELSSVIRSVSRAPKMSDGSNCMQQAGKAMKTELSIRSSSMSRSGETPSRV
jgi:hypothetical protein